MLQLERVRDRIVISGPMAHERGPEAELWDALVLGVRDASNDGEFTVLSCRLVERGDDLVQPADEQQKVEAKPGFAIVDHGVKL